MMDISQHGISFLSGWEGIRREPYNDDGVASPHSQGNCTVGIGYLIHYNQCDGRVQELPYQHLTIEQVYTLFHQTVKSYVDGVNRYINVPLTQNAFDALVSFTYNNGVGALATSEVRRSINTGAPKSEVYQSFLRYVKPAWAEAALTRRRKDEFNLFYDPKIYPDAPAQEGDQVKLAAWWENRKIGPGHHEINLAGDFGPGSQILALILADDNTGRIGFSHGDFTEAKPMNSNRAATFILVPGQFGTALFDVDGEVHVKHLGSIGSLP